MGDRLEDLEDHDWKIAGSCFACLISSRSQFRGRSELTSIVCSGRGMPDFISTVSTVGLSREFVIYRVDKLKTNPSLALANHISDRPVISFWIYKNQ